MAQCIVNYGGLEVIRTDFIALYCMVPNRNLQGLPKHLNGHPKVSEQNLLPQNMVWRTREASRLSRPPRAHHDFPAPTRPHQTPLHRGEGGKFTHQTPHHRGGGGNAFPHTRPHTTAGEEEGGLPPTTPHTTEGEGERGTHPPKKDSQSTPPQPTPQKGGASQTIWGGVGGGRGARDHINWRGGAIDTATRHHMCVRICIYSHKNSTHAKQPCAKRSPHLLGCLSGDPRLPMKDCSDRV